MKKLIALLLLLSIVEPIVASALTSSAQFSTGVAPSAHRTSNASLSPTGSSSFCTWANWDSSFAQGNIMNKFNSGDSDRGVFMSYANASGINVTICGDASCAANSLVITSAFTPSFGTWYHWCFVYDAPASTLTLYKNGVSVASDNTPATITTQNDNNAVFNIGSYNSGAGDYFDGKISQASYWSKVLSPSEIAGFMCTPPTGAEANLIGYWALDGANGADASPNANNLTLNNVTTSASLPTPVCANSATGMNIGSVKFGTVNLGR